MQQQNKSAPVLALALVNGVIIALAIVVVSLISHYPINVDFILLCLFISFIGSFGVLYFYHYVIINKRINTLSEKIRVAFMSKDVPVKQSILEETDSLNILNERVQQLIDTRERERIQFENLDSYRKEYLGNVSHELKTPIFNIQGYVDTLLNGGMEDPEINFDYLKRAEKSIDRLINIIDDLETITQLETGDLHLEMEKFDITLLCKDIYSQLELIAAKKNIFLQLAKKYDKPIYVMADKFRIRQVLVNLITNSIKYGKENGKTIIKLTSYNDDVIVEVIDDGVGIEEKHLPRLFERFYRVDKGRSREQGGTGLGLAIVKHILEAHNKSIQVESKVGHGTRFIFSLKAAD